MLKINIIGVGSIKEEFHRLEIEEYLKRLSRYAKVNILEVSEENEKKGINNVLEKEGERLLKMIKDDDYVILLDLHGQEIDSIKFASKLKEIQNTHSSISFVIGGSYGLSNEVRARANFKWKLSDLTFTHQITRILVLEQIYRGFKINNNETYHK